MERQMDSWNDDRLDALSRDMNERFDKVDERFEKVDERFEKVATKEELGEIKAGMGEIRGELRYLNARFDRLFHALMVGGISFGIAAFAALVTQA